MKNRTGFFDDSMSPDQLEKKHKGLLVAVAVSKVPFAYVPFMLAGPTATAPAVDGFLLVFRVHLGNGVDVARGANTIPGDRNMKDLPVACVMAYESRLCECQGKQGSVGVLYPHVIHKDKD